MVRTVWVGSKAARLGIQIALTVCSFLAGEGIRISVAKDGTFETFMMTNLS